MTMAKTNSPMPSQVIETMWRLGEAVAVTKALIFGHLN
jgi:hypothetical protein